MDEEECTLSSKGVQPVEILGQTNIRTDYYRKLLWNLLQSQFEVECDEGIDKGYVLHNLLIGGMLAVSETPLGVLPLRCSLTGVNVFNLPTHVRIIGNGIPQTLEKCLYTDEVVLYHTQRIQASQVFFSYQYLITAYAEMLAQADKSICMNMINCNSAFVLDAESKGQAEAIKKAFDEAQKGKPLVIFRSSDGLNVSDGLHMLTSNISQSYIANDVFDTKRTIMNEFLTWIGINNSPIDRNERVTTVETRSNDEQIECNIKVLRDILEECNEEREKKFPDFNFSIKVKEREKVDLDGAAGLMGNPNQQNNGPVSR